MSQENRLNFGVHVNNRAAVFLPDYSIGQLLDLAVEAEELGYQLVWLGDSMLAKPRYDPIVTFAAIAARTRTIRLASGILQSHLRNPVVLALEWATLDIISRGRTLLGLGVGAASPELTQKECEVAGFPKRLRGKVFEESIDALKALWTQETATFEGTHFVFREVTLGYKPVQKPHPPIWIAAGGYNPQQPGTGPFGYHVASEAGQFRGAFERVARLADGWMTTQATPEEYAETYARIERTAKEKYGRPAGAIHPAMDFWINVGANKQAARDEAKWILENYHQMPMDDETLERWVIYGNAEECIQRLVEFEAVGVRTLKLDLAVKNQRQQMHRIAQEIIPAFRG